MLIIGPYWNSKIYTFKTKIFYRINSTNKSQEIGLLAKETSRSIISRFNLLITLTRDFLCPEIWELKITYTTIINKNIMEMLPSSRKTCFKQLRICPRIIEVNQVAYISVFLSQKGIRGIMITVEVVIFNFKLLILITSKEKERVRAILKRHRII